LARRVSSAWASATVILAVTLWVSVSAMPFPMEMMFRTVAATENSVSSFDVAIHSATARAKSFSSAEWERVIPLRRTACVFFSAMVRAILSHAESTKPLESALE
jgi:flavin-binding protein dodecin